jgi:3-hydroxybutyryl-CoA dehydratase
MRDFEVGRRAEVTKTITDDDVRTFARLTGDFNPLHVDDAYAAASRFGRRIAHGMLTAGLVSAVLGMHLPGPGGIYLTQSLKFARPVYPGDTITALAEVIAFDAERRRLRVKTLCTNQRGEPVLEGEAVLLVDLPAVPNRGGTGAV